MIFLFDVQLRNKYDDDDDALTLLVGRQEGHPACKNPASATRKDSPIEALGRPTVIIRVVFVGREAGELPTHWIWPSLPLVCLKLPCQGKVDSPSLLKFC